MATQKNGSHFNTVKPHNNGRSSMKRNSFVSSHFSGIIGIIVGDSFFPWNPATESFYCVLLNYFICFTLFLGHFNISRQYGMRQRLFFCCCKYSIIKSLTLIYSFIFWIYFVSYTGNVNALYEIYTTPSPKSCWFWMKSTCADRNRINFCLLMHNHLSPVCVVCAPRH